MVDWSINRELQRMLGDTREFLHKHGRGTPELEFIASLHDRILDVTVEEIDILAVHNDNDKNSFRNSEL